MNKSRNKIIFSIAGLTVLFVIIVVINIISIKIHSRIDLTEDRLYTLSNNSKRILAKLDTPVTIRYYFSKSNPRLPTYFKSYAQRVEDLLYEYDEAGNGNIIVKKFDPKPDSDAADSAELDGVKGQVLNTGDKLYLGISISCLDKTVTLPFLSIERENLIEYDITNAISRVFKTKKSIIGVMSALPVLGEKPTPMMMQRGQFQSTPAWVSIKELQKDFEVKNIPLDTEKIDKNIDLLFVIHPSGISEKTQFAIDQFVLRGGKLIAYLDPLSYYAKIRARSNRQMMGKLSSDMKTLLKTWKIDYSPRQVVGDMVFSKRIVTPQKKLNFVSVLDITKKGFNNKEVISAQLNKVTMVFPGGFTGTPAEGLKKTVLIKTTDDSGLINSGIADNPGVSFKEFNADSKTYDLAISLTGHFKTAFPEGKPKDKKADKKDAAKEKNDMKNDYLTESEREGMVILIADSDILVDDVCVQISSFLNQHFMVPKNDNLNFTQNLADFTAGDSDLIGIRCRQKISRPFEVVNEIQAAAEKKFKKQILALEEKLKSSERKLNKLQRNKSKDQQFILSPEQKKELKNFEKQQADVRKELKVVRKQLRKDIDSLENRLKWINIALIPVLVSLFGIIVAIIRKKRSSAK